MIITSLAIICLLIGFLYELFLFFTKQKNELKKETNCPKDPNFCVLIPARNESKVIKGILESLMAQTYAIPKENIYIIVETTKDPTCKIVQKYGMNIFVRQKLSLKTKGYALEEMVEDLCEKGIYYDAYFIFDADNILDKHFMEHMLKDYQEGYAISTGYRALKNSEHYFPVCAGLTFYMMNEIRNRNALKHQGNLILSGTGYYIHGNYIKKWKTFPFHSLTEDYESSLYYTLHGISTHYQTKAIFYDEQPTSYKQSITQRSRWIKGYLTNWFNYRPLLKKQLKKKPLNKGSIHEMRIGIIPALWIVIGLLLFLLNSFLAIGLHFTWQSLLFLGLYLLIIYIILIFITAVLLYLARKELHLSKRVLIGTLLYHPIFLISYLHAFLIAILKKDLSWEPIKHTNSKKRKI